VRLFGWLYVAVLVPVLLVVTVLAIRRAMSGGDVAGSVLLERALGGTATLALAGVGFVLAVGHYDVGAYLWVEAAFVAAIFAFFNRVADAFGLVDPGYEQLQPPAGKMP